MKKMIILLASLIIGTVNCMDHEAEVKFVNISTKAVLFLTCYDVVNIPPGHSGVMTLKGDSTGYVEIYGQRLSIKDLHHTTLTWDGCQWRTIRE